MADKKSTASTSKRAALRAQQEAQESAKKRRRIIGVIAGVLVAAAIVVSVVFGLNRKSDDAPTGSQITPPSATKDGIYTLNKDKVKDGAPTLTVFQDYQCPACKATEDLFGKSLNDLSAKGEIKLQYHTLTFLDNNLKNDSSTRAAMAAAAADVVGHYEAYHDVVYSHQPEEEGAGYTDEQLRKEFATEAGITGKDLTTFQKVYDSKRTQDFVENGNDKGLQELQKFGSAGTPTFLVNGKPWEGWQSFSAAPSADDLLAAIKKAD
ncbi:thioredoxin domain-containing protein [Cutibacterium equinum]|uniref:Thioredoxin domain-containing protein n=1 Tax=Cutibacterium equinum TaxID=3016342 RepID=A0ABY7QW82_9ACTN|nr:thioredoxin domain-containing protein [Cutibacterium equinum]WCC79318.1 thioredoxin domain-containing protein [Cutibacterium equinum]